MSQVANPMWDQWLADADSANTLGPDEYDDDAELLRVRALHAQLSGSLPKYAVKTLSPSVYQDGTGLAECRICVKDTDPKLKLQTVALVLLSHFGGLATIADCDDPTLLTTVRSMLEALGHKYIDFNYLDNKVYEGKCETLVGLNCVNRYFAIAPQFNNE